MRRWCEGGGMVLTRVLYGGEKVSLLPLTRRLDYRLPKGREQVTGKLDIGREGVEIMTLRRMGDVATDVLLDEVLGGRVDEMLLDRDANLGALLRLRRHFPKAALKLTDVQWVYLSEMYEVGMTVTEIAALHDVNKNTVSRIVNRAKKTLQDYLQFCL